MVITFRAHAMTLLQRDLVDDRATRRAFIPQAFRHVGLFFPERTDGAHFENAHGVISAELKVFCVFRPKAKPQGVEAQNMAKNGAITTVFVPHSASPPILSSHYRDSHKRFYIE